MEKITDTLYSWASLLEPETRAQAEALSRLPIIAGHVALMPDAHLGKGSTVGSVIPTAGAVIPAAIGVDIGCGMGAALTNLTSRDLPDSLDSLVDGFDRVVPAGLGHWHRDPLPQAYTWWEAHEDDPASELTGKQIKTLLVQLGTLGSGNHFLEVVLDEQDRVWVFLHSGSRGIGNQLALAHMAVARRVCRYEFKALRGHRDDEDLAWLTEGTPEFDAYIADMRFAQAYALENRSIMMDSALAYLFRWIRTQKHRTKKNPVEIDRINTHHNFTESTLWPPDEGQGKLLTGRPPEEGEPQSKWPPDEGEGKLLTGRPPEEGEPQSKWPPDEGEGKLLTGRPPEEGEPQSKWPPDEGEGKLLTGRPPEEGEPQSKWPPDGGGPQESIWITRKGAIKAGKGDLGLIPGSMGQRSYVVEGLGSVDSYWSCSHGAGRKMSRSQARRELSVDTLNRKMKGLAWQAKDAQRLLDEHPSAYKNIDQVMADQTDLVKVLHTFRAIANYKGVN